MNSRIVWADALKGILIVLVVLGHSIQASMIQLHVSFIDDYLWNLIYSFHMPAFIAVSGFVSFRTNGQVGDWFSFTCRRFRQLIVPFLIWSVALLIVNRNVSHYLDYLLYPQKSLWFLWALFFIAIIFSGIDHIARRVKLNQEVAVAFGWVLLVGVMFVMPDAKLFGVEYVAYYFFFYILGYYFHKYLEIIIIKKEWGILLFGILWFTLGSIYSTQGLPNQLKFISFLPSSLLYYIYRIVTAFLAIIFLFSASKKWLSKIGDIISVLVLMGMTSLGIYAVHMVLRHKIVQGLVFLFPSISYWPMMITCFIILLPVSYWIVWLLNRNKYTRIFLLGKL